MKLVSKESLKVNKINEEIIDEEVINEMFSIKDIEKKINESIEVVSDKIVDKILDKITRDKDLIDNFTDTLLKKITIKIEKV